MSDATDSGTESTAYVCRDCGDAIDEPVDTTTCPNCGGHLVDTSVPHD